MAEVKMEVEEIPGNSDGQKENKENIEVPDKKVIKQVAIGKLRKKNIFDNIVSTALKGVGTYILFELLVPAGKNLLSDIINNASDMIIFGEPKYRKRNSSVGSRVSYENYYGRDRERYSDRNRPRTYARSTFDTSDILLPSREEADDVLQGVFAIYDAYNMVSVADFLELVGLPDEYTDQNFGWVHLVDAQIKRVRDGFVIEMPVPRELPR